MSIGSPTSTHSVSRASQFPSFSEPPRRSSSPPPRREPPWSPRLVRQPAIFDSGLKSIFVSSLENSRSVLRVEPSVEHDLRQEQWSHVEQLHEGETERHLLQVINVSLIFCKLYLLSFSSEEREKGWFLTSRMTFSELGMINERHFINQDICK